MDHYIYAHQIQGVSVIYPHDVMLSATLEPVADRVHILIPAPVIEDIFARWSNQLDPSVIEYEQIVAQGKAFAEQLRAHQEPVTFRPFQANGWRLPRCAQCGDRISSGVSNSQITLCHSCSGLYA